MLLGPGHDVEGAHPDLPGSERTAGRAKRALIVNAYAIGNWGDAAIVEGVIHSLRTSGFSHITIAPVDWASNQGAWRQLGADEVVPPLLAIADVPRLFRRPKLAMLLYMIGRGIRYRLTPRSTDRAATSYRQADLVVSAGGAYLGGSKPGSNLVKSMNIRAAAMAGRPCVIAPVTVNPFPRVVGSILGWGFKGALVFVRDQPSRDLLAAAGIDARLAHDMALHAPSLVQAASARRVANPPFRVIGWAPRAYRTDHGAWGQPELAERTTFDAIRRILGETDDRLRFIPHVRAGANDDDLQAVNRLLGGFTQSERAKIDISDDPSTLHDAIERYADLDVLIASRMHAAIFAMAVGTPAIAVGYEPKVEGVMADLGLDDRVVPADSRLSVATLLTTVERLRTPLERERTHRAFRIAQGGFTEFEAALAAAGR